MLVTAGSVEEKQEEKMQAFETQAQEWFASLHEVQIGLRSAVNHLRKAQLPPVAYDISSESPSSGSASMASGSASRGHALNFMTTSKKNGETSTGSHLLNDFLDAVPNGTGHGPPGFTSDFGEESKLSLSTLRLQHAGWKQLGDSLQRLADMKMAAAGFGSSDAESEGTAQPDSSSRRKKKPHPLPHERREPVRQADDLIEADKVQDSRLLTALFQSDHSLGPTRTSSV
jgi:hypothetical protein